MLVAALRPCAHPGCRELVKQGRCTAHTKQRYQQQDERRGSAAQRGYDSTWRRLRIAYLSRNPLCANCKQRGRIVPAAEVHHIRPIAEAPELRLNTDNLMALCKPCHSTITLRDSVRDAASLIGG